MNINLQDFYEYNPQTNVWTQKQILLVELEVKQLDFLSKLKVMSGQEWG